MHGHIKEQTEHAMPSVDPSTASALLHAWVICVCRIFHSAESGVCLTLAGAATTAKRATVKSKANQKKKTEKTLIVTMNKNKISGRADLNCYYFVFSVYLF